MPNLGKIGRQGHDLRAHFVVDLQLILLTLVFTLSLCLRQGSQGHVPIGFELVGNQAIVGIDA